MDSETIVTIQAYGYFFFVMFLVFILYGYIYHLYRSERIGRRNYEKYGNIAVDDEITDRPVESFEENNAKIKEEQ